MRGSVYFVLYKREKVVVCLFGRHSETLLTMQNKFTSELMLARINVKIRRKHYEENTTNFSIYLILGNVSENTPKLEDSLYQAGCDDALINF